MSEIEAIQNQIDALNAWLAELNEQVDPDDPAGVVPEFDYSPELAVALDLHGIDDPDEAAFVFTDRLDDLLDMRATIEAEHG